MSNTSRVARVQREHLKNLDATTTLGKIVSVSPETESMVVDIGSSSVQVAHPFSAGNSWIRAIPSVGTSCTLAYNKTQNSYDFLAYVQSQDVATAQLANYTAKQSLYRTLKEGEIELSSSGGATIFMGSRPVLSGRAGAVSWQYDSDKLEASTTAPTHVIRGHNNKTDRIGNEIRFGAVKRPTSSTSESYALTAPLSIPASGIYTYAYEHLVSLDNDLGAPLIDHRIGEVYENTLVPGTPFAAPALGRKSKLPLRARHRYFSTIEPGGIQATNQSTDVEISCLGDVDVMLSKLALLGLSVDVPSGSITAKSGLGASLISKLAILVKSELATVNLDAGASVGIAARTSMTTKSGTDISSSSGTSQTHKATTSFDLKAGTSLSINGVTVDISSTGNVTIHGALGLSLSGAMGKTGRPIATQPTCFVTGLPFFIDPTLSS